jgi:hypothetical protein
MAPHLMPPLPGAEANSRDAMWMDIRCDAGNVQKLTRRNRIFRKHGSRRRSSDSPINWPAPGSGLRFVLS